MKDSFVGKLALVWVMCGVLAIAGGVIQKDPTALAVVFLAITLGFREAK